MGVFYITIMAISIRAVVLICLCTYVSSSKNSSTSACGAAALGSAVSSWALSAAASLTGANAFSASSVEEVSSDASVWVPEGDAFSSGSEALAASLLIAVRSVKLLSGEAVPSATDFTVSLTCATEPEITSFALWKASVAKASALSRFKEFPINIRLINRFTTPKNFKNTCEDLANGKIDIIFGTHKLFNSKVEYKNLGLLIIDEEQRFGVAQKEKLKELEELLKAKELKISRSYVSRIEKRALTKILREFIKNKKAN